MSERKFKKGRQDISVAELLEHECSSFILVRR